MRPSGRDDGDQAAQVLKAFFDSGHAVDLVLLVIVVEFVFLTVRRAGRGERLSLTDRALAFAPGIWLLLALRAALTGAGWIWVALALAVSFPFHVADQMRRSRRAPEDSRRGHSV